MNLSITREFVNRHKMLVTLSLYLILLTMAAFIFRKDVGAFYTYRLKGIIQRENDPERYERFKVAGEEFSFQTFPVIFSNGRKRVSYEVSARTGDSIEVGIIRKAGKDNSDGDLRLRIFQKRLFGKDVLSETIPVPDVGERICFRMDTNRLHQTSNNRFLIAYELDAVDADSKEIPPEEFAYLVPRAFSKRKPGEFNVLMISFDTLRADHLGCYGYDRDTSPNIDNFAKQAVVFSQAISAAPWTTAAHYSLFTSLYPAAHQNEKNQSHNYLYSQKTLIGPLQENGYYSIAFTGGGSISSAFGFGKDFNVYHEYSSYANRTPFGKGWTHADDTEKAFTSAMRWLEENVDTKFFLFLHTFEAHDPYEHISFLERNDVKTLIDKRIALYDGDIRYADFQFGRLLKKLDSLGLISNTIIVLLSDHGDDFYDHYTEKDIIPTYEEPVIPEISAVDHGHSLYDELIHVPLIIRVPGLDPPKNVIENQVRTIDIMPTILDFLGIDFDITIQGTSFKELVATGSRKEDPAAISESTVYGPRRASVRKDGYKYIRIDDLKTIMGDMTYKNLNQYELFDLTKDPDEKNNIYDANPELAAEYDKILQEHLKNSSAINAKLREQYDSAAQPEEQKLDKDVIANLKALGYLK